MTRCQFPSVAPPCISSRPARSRRGSDGSVSSAGGSRRRRLVPALVELEANFRDAWSDEAFRNEYASLLSSYVGRPTPVTECHRLSERLGVRVLLKREDLSHTGSHKINNVLGQCLLTRAHGQEARHRRDGCRSARRGRGHRRRAVRPRLHRLHGRRRRGAPGAQRVAYEAARRRRGAGRVGERDPQGRGERGDARLGRVGRVDALLHRFGDGPASVPVDGARVPARRRRRGARADARAPRRP